MTIKDENKLNLKSYLLLGLSFFLLALVYISQQFNYLAIIGEIVGLPVESYHPYTFFIVNKYLRFFMNDTIMVGVIWLLFREMKYLKLALIIELAGLLVILPLYLVIKLQFEGDSEISSPLFSFIHRLIVNPTLLILLIPAIYYQKKIQKN